MSLRSVDGDPTPSPQQVTGLVIAVVLLLGLLASAIVWKLADIDAADRAQAAADAVVASVDRSIDDHLIATSGVDAVAGPDGSVTQSSLTDFANRLATAGRRRPVSWIVPLGDPAGSGGWEVRLSAEGPTTETGAPGESMDLGPLSPGTVVPADSNLASALDLVARTGQPMVTRVDFGDDSARLVVLDPVQAPGTPSPGGAAPTEETIGVVASLDPPNMMESTIESDSPGDVRYRVTDGHATLAESSPPPEGGVTRRTTASDTTLLVEVEDARPVHHDLSWFIMWMTAIVIVAAGIVGLRSIRFERERRLTTAMIAGTATLAHHLARAATAEEVATFIGQHVPQVVGARLASFGAVDDELGVVRLHHGTGLDPDLTRAFDEVSFDAVPGLATAVVSGSTVLLGSERQIRRELSAPTADALLSAGARSAAVLPLSAQDRGVVAIVGILWWSPQRFDARTTTTLETIRELCEQSLDRAELTDRVSLRASHLAELAERLAGVDDVTDAARTAASMAFNAVGARAASVAVSEPDGIRLEVHDGDPFGSADGPTLHAADADTAMARVARSGIPALFHDAEAAGSRYPDGVTADRTDPPGARAVFPLRADDRIVGAMAFAWDRPVTFSDDLVHELTTVSGITAQSVRRAQLIEERVSDARRSEALSQLAQGLASRADTVGIADFLAGALTGPFDARHAIFGYVEHGRFVRRYSKSLIDTGLTDVGRELAQSDLAQRTPATDAFRGDHLVFVGSRQEARGRFPELCAAWDAIGIRSCAAVPVRSGTGAVIATLSVMWDRSTVLSDELRDMLSTVAGMVGQTLERTGLVDELRSNAERFESLADFAQLLASVRTTDELIRSVADHAAAAVGASTTAFGLLDGDDVRSVADRPGSDLLPGSDSPSSRSENPERASQGHRSTHPAFECLDTERTVFHSVTGSVGSADARAAARSLSSVGLRSSAHVPLLDSDGRGIGVLAVGWEQDLDGLTGTIRSKLRTLAELCAQTYQRVRLGEAEHRVVVDLQDRVVRPVPDVAGLSIAQRYLPASAQVGIGGDWYEGIPLDDDCVAVVVGDIAGHGIGAVVDMVELRAVIGSYLRGGTPLGEIYPKVTALMCQSGTGLTATSCTAVIDTSTNKLHYVSAGHLPPVLARPDGHVELLAGGRQPLLGVSKGPVVPGEAPFPPGSLLALYTDGIVERRREPIDDSLARLSAAVSDLVRPGSPLRTDEAIDVDALADELLRRCLGRRPTDDDVALVLIARL